MQKMAFVCVCVHVCLWRLLLYSVAEAQTQLASATEKERFASEKLMEVNARLASLESQISVLRQERSRLLADLEVERTKYELVEEAKTKWLTPLPLAFVWMIFAPNFYNTLYCKGI